MPNPREVIRSLKKGGPISLSDLTETIELVPNTHSKGRDFVQYQLRVDGDVHYEVNCSETADKNRFVRVQVDVENDSSDRHKAILDDLRVRLRETAQQHQDLFGSEEPTEESFRVWVLEEVSCVDRAKEEIKQEICTKLKLLYDHFEKILDDYAHKSEIANLKHAMTNEIKELLLSNLNVILTGAPGTGKTYTAKQVASAFVDESLDEQLLRGDADLTYDDKENVLKRYFSNPEKYFPDSKELGSKPNEFKQAVFTDSVQFHPGYDYSDFVIGMKPVLLSKKGKELVMKEGRYIVADTGNEPDPEDLAETKVSFRWKDGIFKKFAKRAKDAYEKAEDKEKAPRFVFLIDEINRADLSRVFGELFSLLEEGYRYPNGENSDFVLLPNGERFSIPKNLYVIGTMNDIDRSVESMDFALRRRFAWKEVKPEDTAGAILALVPQKETLLAKMNAVNELIRSDEFRLGCEYQLGGAIFAKFGKCGGDFERLWKNHIEIILNEYLRGRRDRKELVDKLKAVFDGAPQTTGTTMQPAATAEATPGAQ